MTDATMHRFHVFALAPLIWTISCSNDVDPGGPGETEGAVSKASATLSEDSENSTSGTTDDPSTSSSGDIDQTGTSGTSGTSDTGSTGDPSLCGNGVIEGDEECDEAGDNSNSGACTLSCTIATCGDGYVYLGDDEEIGTEQCDDANDIQTDSCIECVKATCGDNIIWADSEDCEGNQVNNEGDVCQGCMWTPGYTAFISSVEWPADFSIPPELPDGYTPDDFPNTNFRTGVQLADLRCQQLASVGELVDLENPAQYVAWLSDNSGNNQSDAILRLNPVPEAAYVSPNSITIVNAFGDLENGSLVNAISETESGSIIPGFAQVWSNTDTSGHSLDLNDGQNPTSCEEWTSTDNGVHGQIGHVATNQPEWTDINAVLKCSFRGRIYCLQKPPAEQ